MNREEALFLLGNEDFQDHFDELFFTVKKYFVTSAILPKLFISKTDQLMRWTEAYEILSLSTFPKQEEVEILVLNSVNIQETITSFHAGLYEMKSALFASSNPRQVDAYARALLKLYYSYACLWPEIDADETIRVSVEPDPMALLKAAKKVNPPSFEQLSQISPKNAVVREAKRLTLWREMFGDGI